ncbi:DUF3871 family protein [Chryseobacterium gleum]|uniref:DUF3871 family protein n=1 Tax=Chryseobacterium gleum TaxID=250 RepID=UPI00293EDC02|nr:DUF3871 family protein [Chryseobacterium gleum]
MFQNIIGESRLYQHLPKPEKQNIPLLNFNDSHINTIAKDYYEDKNFCRQEDGNINLWNVYNLFTHYSLVSHDQIWNLIPSDKKINLFKKNELPIL